MESNNNPVSTTLKELIQDLNLPKQILDKTEELMKTLFGPATKELGELFADSVRYRRLKNQVAIFHKTATLLEKNKLIPKELKLKTLVPLLEQCSLEEDVTLQEKWANLIANIASKSENGLEPRLVKTLSNITSLEANMLDFSFSEMHANRKSKLDYHKSLSTHFQNNTLDSIKLDNVIIKVKAVKEHFNLEEQTVSVSIDNMILLGLLKYEEPEIEVENNASSDDSEIDVSASYNQSDNFRITSYGRYFIETCKEPKS